MEITITDVPEQNRYEARDENGRRVGLLEYTRSTGEISLDHTEVDSDAEGQGVGSMLARHALDRARDDGASVRPLCPFVGTWIDRHPDYQDLVAG